MWFLVAIPVRTWWFIVVGSILRRWCHTNMEIDTASKPRGRPAPENVTIIKKVGGKRQDRLRSTKHYSCKCAARRKKGIKREPNLGGSPGVGMPDITEGKSRSRETG